MSRPGDDLKPLDGDDPIDRGIEQLRDREPAPPRASLSEEILAQFDRQLGSIPSAGKERPGPRLVRAGVGRGFARVAAAAVLLLIPLHLARQEFKAAFERDAGTLAEAEMALLEWRLEELERRVSAHRWEPVVASDRPAEEPVESVKDDPADRFGGPDGGERLLALAGDDPAILRLTAARAFEELNADAAARRYREVVERYADGPAAEVARERLAKLAR